jgi:hypothetical protein
MINKDLRGGGRTEEYKDTITMWVGIYFLLPKMKQKADR